MMLPDLDETRKQLPIIKAALEHSDVDIGSDMERAICAPNPTVNLYPYDIWGNHELSNHE